MFKGNKTQSLYHLFETDDFIYSMSFPGKVFFIYSFELRGYGSRGLSYHVVVNVVNCINIIYYKD